MQIWQVANSLRARIALAGIRHQYNLPIIIYLLHSDPGVFCFISLGGEDSVLPCVPWCVVASMTQHMDMMMDFSDEEEKEEAIPIVAHLEYGGLFKELTDGTTESLTTVVLRCEQRPGVLYVCVCQCVCSSVGCRRVAAASCRRRTPVTVVVLQQYIPVCIQQ